MVSKSQVAVNTVKPTKSSRKGIVVGNGKIPIKEVTTTPCISSDDESNPVARDLRLLRAILKPSAEISRRLGAARRPKSTQTASRSRTNTLVKSSKPEEADSLKHGSSNVLSILEQKKLAMSSFNTSLKSLSSAAKRHQDQKREPPQANSTKTIHTSREASTPVSEISVQHNVEIYAECASVALDVLRLHDTDDTSTTEGSLKRENGAIALLDKFNTLEMTEKAQHQATRIHDQYRKWRRETSTTRTKSLSSTQCVLHELVSMPLTPISKADFDFTCAFQCQVLRLAILSTANDISVKFLTAIELEVAGSPGHVVLAGKGDGFVDEDKAARNLLTIAQALMKLYTNFGRSAGDNGPERLIESLLTLRQALSYRIKAYILMKQFDRIEIDVWPVLEKGIRRIWSGIDDNEVLYKMTEAAIAYLRKELGGAHMKSTLPKTMLKYLIALAEQNNDTVNAEKWLIELASFSSGIPHVVCLCQIACLNILSDTRASDSVERACEALSAERELKLSSDALLTVVRLRKASSQILGMSLNSTQPMAPSERMLASTCLRALYTIFDFLRSRLSDSDDKLFHSVSLAVLKSIEAIADAEAVVLLKEEDMLDTFLDQIRFCVTYAQNSAAHKTASELQPEVLASLKIKLSNVLWRAHLLPAITSRGHATVCELASQSISCLDGLSKDELSRAALGPRLEKLASLYTEDGRLEDAKAALERAIRHYILNDALANAVEASLTKQSSLVWSDTASLASQLGRALQAFNCSGSSESLEYFFDDSTLPDPHRAVLLEAQVSNASKKRLARSELQAILEKLRVVMKLASPPLYHVWQMRTLSIVVHRLSRSQDISDLDREILVKLLEKSLSYKSIQPASFLMSYSTSLRCVVLIQHSLLANQSNSVSVQEGVLQLSALLKEHTQEHTTMVDDTGILVSSLRSLASKDFAMASYADAAACLELQLVLTSNKLNMARGEIFDSYTTLAQCRIRLDDVVSAGTALENAKTILPTGELSLERQMLIHMIAAEMELAACRTEPCQQHLHEAATIFTRMQANCKDMKSTERLRRDGVIATAALLSSRLALQKGELRFAARYARQAAKICVSIWAALQKPKSRTIMPSQGDEPAMRSLVNDVSHLRIADLPQERLNSVKSHLIWTYSRIYVDSLSHAADVFAHCGLFEDAIHYHEQLQKLQGVDAISQNLSTSNATYAKLLAFSGAPDLALNLCKSALNWNITWSTKADIAEIYLRFGLVERANELTIGMTQHSMSFQALARHPGQNCEKVDLTSQKRKVTARGKAIKAPAKRKNQHPDTKQDIELRHSERHTQIQSWNQLHEEDMLKAVVKEIAIVDQKLASYSDESLQCESRFSTQPRFLVRNILSTAKLIFARAWNQLSANTMQSVLADSALALPVKSTNKRRQGRISLLQSDRNAKSSHLSPHQYEKQQTDVASQFQAAQKLCELLLTDRKEYCSIIMINTIARLQARISLLLSTMDRPFTISTTELVLMTGLPSDEALDREMMISAAEGLTADREALSKWPSQSGSPLGYESKGLASRLDDLPHSWIVVSISLAETKDELIISKIVAGNEPFLVRIPLHRSNEGETADFGFGEALSEMNDIITKANDSSHDERGAGDKQSRLVWHREREDLDERLHVLLQNIESVWLGGFRGMLSPNPPSHATETFRNSLNQALDMHLPSRQKSSNTCERVVIHDEVLDLFLGLNNSEDEELDDAVMDLLYFVVDILQFSGENNAYDEIDWDALLVNTLDSLRACHESARSQNDRHLILVIDKELECIPWESLPCLIEYPVSRMPSLGTIFERLDRARQQSQNACAFSISASRATGSYILNPAGNLMPTQERLEPILRSLSAENQFTAIMNNAPSETQMSKLLSESDILLYFGHGSGAQYIRPRTIRALPRCATTFLFGCSSAKMTVHGDFESTGMPRAYMLGHSPAVVGCLWDVTDREIDRVAVKTLSEWGLIDGTEAKVQEILSRTKLKSKPSVKKNGIQKVPAKKTLVEAVRDGRKVAVLKYLCGAAVVVYGIPVTLDQRITER